MAHLSGNLTGLKPNQLRRLERLDRRRVPTTRVLSPELANGLAELSTETGRQVGVLVDRTGAVRHVIVGTAHSTPIPDFGRVRAGRSRVRGLRLVHTRVEGAGLSREDLTDLALLRLDLVATVALADDGRAGPVSVAHLVPPDDGHEPWRILPPKLVHDLDLPFDDTIRALEEEFDRKLGAIGVEQGAERAMLVSVTRHGGEEARHSIDELERIAASAGLVVVERILQRRDKLDAHTFMGRGRAEDVAIRALGNGATVLVFDQDLSPSQSKALSDLTQLKILDRTGLILDLFAQRARSRDGRLQVELAQLRYRMPHLKARDDSLSRLSGGIGGRGPGETRLEEDRRKARDRIARLEREVEVLAGQRAGRRARRERTGIPVVALVGYTNAGKSSLLNALTKAKVFTQDRLFATLDPTSRKLRFASGRLALLTDTVGFIRDLPPDLVAAFRATLEELSEADLLLHVVDGSSPRASAQIEIVDGTLRELGLSELQVIVALNKCDAADRDALSALQRDTSGVILSAHTGEGLGALLATIERLLPLRRWESNGAGDAGAADDEAPADGPAESEAEPTDLEAR
ncbi:MAG: GTPase HflX [Polyangiaceae bacterium]|nr:GTPase HflX [Polyangiaceae bacterium]